MKKWFENNVISMSTLSAVIIAVFWAGSNEGRLFTNVENRVKAENYIESAETPEQRKMRLLIDSINNSEVVKSRRKRDSILLDMSIRIKHQDSINLLNADQMYQIKEILNME